MKAGVVTPRTKSGRTDEESVGEELDDGIKVSLVRN